MKRNLAVILVVMLVIGMLAGCGKKEETPSNEPDQTTPAKVQEPEEPEEPEVEVDTIIIDGYKTPVIQFDLPAGGNYEVSEFDYHDGLKVVDGEFNIVFRTEISKKYVDGSAVVCPYEEMIEYLNTEVHDEVEEVSYAGMDGNNQIRGSGRTRMLFPVEEALWTSPGVPLVLEVELYANSKETEDLVNYMATEEVQLILNSIQLLPAEEPEEVEEPSTETEEPVEVDMGNKPTYVIKDVTISAVLPEDNWCYSLNGFGANYYNVPTMDDVWSNTAHITVNIKESAEKFDFYIDDFENLQSIDGRTIGGIEMVGRTYLNVGMEWIEYIGVIDDTHAVSVLITRVDLVEAEAILDTITFS